MLTINNNEDGTIAKTNYWQSEYNARNLAYLSGHNLSLRLMLPTQYTPTWLPEIKTGKRVLIEPAIRPGYTNHIDIVFDDGTGSPFSICIDRTRQIDRALRSGQTKLLVYFDDKNQPLEFSCLIELPDAPRETFISHVTVSTGHRRRSYRKEVDDNVVELLKSWLPDLFAGQTRGIIEDKYAVRCDWHNSKSAGFTVMRVDDRLAGVELVKFSVCRHSKKAATAWEFVGGRSEIPSVPFVAVALIDANITFEDLGFIPAIADFERCLAWAWMEHQKEI